MQDPNLENTIPSRPNRSIEETVPSHVSHVTDNAETRPTMLETTQPVQGQGPAGPTPMGGKPAKARRWPWILLGVVLVLLLGGLGSWLGYQSAIQLRRAQAEEQKVTLATEQFMLGLVAQQEKRYNIARQHFEFVIQLDPTFPGAVDRLREVMIAQAATATPTTAPIVATPTLTPTQDTRPQEEILTSARQQFANQEWDNLFATIDSLRSIDPAYNAVEIDGMLYFALRFRGVQKILQQGNLEGGIYDLALAEKFGPLDIDAQGYRNWARQYLNGASFWEVDWVRVVTYFEEIYPSFPTCMTARVIPPLSATGLLLANRATSLPLPVSTAMRSSITRSRFMRFRMVSLRRQQPLYTRSAIRPRQLSTRLLYSPPRQV